MNEDTEDVRGDTERARRHGSGAGTRASRRLGAMAALLSCAALGGGCMTGPRYSNEALGVEVPEEGDAAPRAEGGGRGSSPLWKALLQRGDRAPKGRLPELRPDLAALLAPGGPARFAWFGHSTILLGLDGKAILVDPVFSGAASPVGFANRRYQPPVLGLGELPPIDAILLSHDHYDHLDKETIRFFANKGTEFIAPTGVGARLREWGIPPERIFELGWGQSIERRGISYTAAPARHFSGRSLGDRNRTLWASWVLRGARERIFYSGDSGYGPHFAEIGRKFGPFDLAFLENGQYNERWAGIHMMPAQTVAAASELGAAVFVPVHWGMFTESLHPCSEPVRLSTAEARARGIPVMVPELGELSYAIPPAAPPEPWWESMDAEP